MPFPLVPLLIAGGSGLVNFLGQRSANKKAEAAQKRLASGQDYRAALENTYAPWYGTGWTQSRQGQTLPSMRPGGAAGQGGAQQPNDIESMIMELLRNRSMGRMNNMGQGRGGLR